MKMIYAFLKENYEAFESLKQAALLIEALTGEYAISPMNEQRGVLYHLFKMIEDESEESLNENFFAAKEHLYRALYDSYSILQARLIKDIGDISKKYDTKTIAIIYPILYQDVEPKITIIQDKLINLRSARPSEYPNINIETTWANTLYLVGEKDKLVSKIPEFENYESEQKLKQEEEKKKEEEKLKKEREREERKQKEETLKNKFEIVSGIAIVLFVMLCTTLALILFLN